MAKNFHTDNKAFMLYKDWEDIFQALDSSEEIGELVMALFAYAKRGETPKLSGGAKIAFLMMRAAIERDGIAWEEMCAQRSECGKKGGRPKKSDESGNTDEKAEQTAASADNAEEKPQGINDTAEKAKKADNDNEYDNDLKENTIDGVKEKRFAPPTLENVSEYCREMGYTNVDAARFIDFYTSNGWMVGKNRMKDWKAAVRNWDRREKNPQRQDGAAEVAKKNRFHNLEEHGYDYDAMVWGMVGAAAQGKAGSAVEPGTG